MASHLKLRFETFKKIPLTEEYGNIDALKSLISKMKLVASDDFDLMLVGKDGAKTPLKLQKEFDNAIKKSNDRSLEIEIVPRKTGAVKKSANPMADSTIHIIDDDEDNLVEVSQILLLTDNQKKKSADEDEFIEIISDESKIELPKPQNFGKKNNSAQDNFELDEEEQMALAENPKISAQQISPTIRKSENSNLELEKLKKELLDRDQKLAALKSEFEDINARNNSLMIQIKGSEIINQQNQAKIKSLEQQLGGKAAPAPKVSSLTHPGIKCGRCNKTPLQGKRYFCLECDNHNVCEECERTSAHDHHAMVRLTAPSNNIQVKLREIFEDSKCDALSFVREALSINVSESPRSGDRAQKISFLKNTLEIKNKSVIDDLLQKYGHLPFDSFCNTCLEKACN